MYVPSLLLRASEERASCREMLPKHVKGDLAGL